MTEGAPSSPQRPGLAGRLVYDVPVAAAATFIVVMIAVGNANTVLRWLTGQQLPGSGELLVVLLPITVFLALPAAERAGANVRSTALVDRLRPGPARTATVLGALVSLATATLLFASTTSKAIDATADGEALVGVRTLPVWPSRIAIAVGLGLLALTLLGELVRALRRRDLVAADEPHLDL